MPRNSSGTYILPGTNPVVTGTTISSTWANGTMSDVGSELTNSLDRQGRSAMLAPLPLAGGAVGAPALTWSADATSGLYRAGAGDYRFSVLGLDSLKVSGGTAATGATPQDALSLPNGYLKLDGAANPNSTVGFKNRLTPKNIAKAWFSYNTFANVTNDAYNMASFAYSSGKLLCTLATGMAGTNYVVVPSCGNPSAIVSWAIVSATQFTIECWSTATDAQIDLSANNNLIGCLVYGAQ